jgi:Domain of unknown function (DUF4262)
MDLIPRSAWRVQETPVGLDVSPVCDDLRMCRICDGLSLDEVLALDAASIDDHGFTVIGVGGPGVGDVEIRPWAYTVGLLDAADHPELVIAGVSMETCGSLLPLLAESVLDGERYEVGDTIDLGRGVVRIGEVNEIQRALGTFNMWDNLQNYGAVQALELEAVQVILPPTFFCSVHGETQPLLDDPDARVGARRPRPNRAERRRRRPHGR